MLKVKLNIMTPEEAFKPFIMEEYLKQDYVKELSQIDTENICDIKYFLDNYAADIQRLTPEQCALLQIDYEDGWYISTWKSEYLKIL